MKKKGRPETESLETRYLRIFHDKPQEERSEEEQSSLEQPSPLTFAPSFTTYSVGEKALAVDDGE